MTRRPCTCRASKHCPASAYTDLLPANPLLKTDYNQCPEPVKLEVDRCRTEMRIRVAASNDPSARICDDNITTLTDAAKAILPSVDTCKRSIATNCTHEFPAEPASLVNLHIVPPWTHTQDNNKMSSSSLTTVHKRHTESLPMQQKIISAAWPLQISGTWMETSQWLHQNSCSFT